MLHFGHRQWKYLRLGGKTVNAEGKSEMWFFKLTVGSGYLTEDKSRLAYVIVITWRVQLEPLIIYYGSNLFVMYGSNEGIERHLPGQSHFFPPQLNYQPHCTQQNAMS